MDEKLVRLEPAADGLAVPTLVVALGGAMDAGGAAQMVGEHLLGSLKHERVATFEPDELFDFQRNRPTIVYEDGTFTDLRGDELVVDVVRDDEGTELLLLHGKEPDLRWNSFTREMVALAERFGVRRAYIVQSFPAGVPHTRPVQITTHASRGDLISEDEGVMGVMQFPAQVPNVLEHAFGERGLDAMGYAAAVPHYLAHNPYPAASAALLRKIAQVGDYALPIGELDAAATRFAAMLNSQVAEDAAQHIKMLETQFDALSAAQPELFSSDRPGYDGDLPSADEIGAAAEAFLADQRPNAEPGQRTDVDPGHQPDGGPSDEPDVDPSTGGPHDEN